ncbi:glucose-6-phosphate 1-epimerase [Skeletonema marinoi]|uniref:Glucose-6-phosphate 1-epimerase n=1 Tax=Skeletonema marinoi TaxID=267567 RepID=A0AAD8YF71_9STRA|nr:glucose-6-phosphate 1-epimerase [Skeletonema marinoi]
MDLRKRPRLNNEGVLSPPSRSTAAAVLQTEIKTLRAELEHSQQIRSIERKNADRSEQRLRRRENKDLIDSLREELDRFNEQMEESREEWREEFSVSNKKCVMLEKRLNAKDNQIEALEEQLRAALQDAAAARQELHEKVSEQQHQFANGSGNGGSGVNDENSSSSRDVRIKIAEVERDNRQLKRQNDDMKQRLQEMIQHKERATTSQRRIKQLEKELQTATHVVEEGAETQRRWMEFRNEIVQEGLIEGAAIKGGSSSSLPPEISTVVRKFQILKRKVEELEGEKSRIGQLSEAHLRRCKVLEAQLNEKTQSLSQLEKDLGKRRDNIDQLELENRKETAQSKMPSMATENVAGLQISLKSARDEIKLLTDTNKKLEMTMEEMKTDQNTAKSEHERVLEKFQKLRSALMEERSKAEAAEARACQAETLAGKGSYNAETTRVVHLESNPLMEAVREKFQTEIDALKLQLEAAQDGRASKSPSVGTSTPASSRGSLGSAGTDVDVQKMHTRLKERFRMQIALFREGVYLLTGFKIDMIDADSDSPQFRVRSIYGEREGDHLMFRWPKKKQTLEIMGTEMAQLLMTDEYLDAFHYVMYNNEYISFRYDKLTSSCLCCKRMVCTTYMQCVCLHPASLKVDVPINTDTMKLSLALLASAFAATSAFSPAATTVSISRSSTSLNASRNRDKVASRSKWAESRGYGTVAEAAAEAAATGLMTNDDGLEYVRLANEAGDTSDIYLFGGVVTSYKVGGQEFIAVRPDAKMDGSKPISGGLSHCWPQFGPGEIQQHGFARNVNWTVKSMTDTTVELEMAPSDYTKEMWDKEFLCTFTVALEDDKLSTKMFVENKGEESFDFQAALHSYFTVSALDNFSIAGSFAGKEFLNKMVGEGEMQTEDREEITISEEYDRVYMGVNDPVLKDTGSGKSLAVMNTAGYEDTVLWNPYGDEGMGYNNFVCVESVKFDPVTLEGGSTWTGDMALKAGAL